MESGSEHNDLERDMESGAEHNYPLTFSVDYPDRELSRVSTFFRVFAVIPIGIVLSLVSGYSSSYGEAGYYLDGIFVVGGFIFFAPLVMLLFQSKYPVWWADWNRELLRFTNRVYIYSYLMDDKYPSTDEQQSVHLDFATPNGEELSRGLPLVKWFLAIPHILVLIPLHFAAFFVTVFAWFAILFTGRYPKGAFEFVEGVFRWTNRVIAYALILVTDEYPPFSLN
jgi:hypothetical protein